MRTIMLLFLILSFPGWIPGLLTMQLLMSTVWRNESLGYGGIGMMILLVTGWAMVIYAGLFIYLVL